MACFLNEFSRFASLLSSLKDELYIASSFRGVAMQIYLSLLTRLHLRLDNIGQAGFSHNFRSLAGSNPPVLAALDSFGTIKPNTSTVLIMLLSEAFPPILKIPTERTEIIKKIRSSISSIAGDLLEDARAQKEAGMSTDRSIIGTLGT
jgi:hypothetical protein